MEIKGHHYDSEVSAIEMEMNVIHEAFLGDWLFCFPHQAVLPHARHDDKSIYDKIHKGIHSYLYNKQAEIETGSIIMYS